MSVSHQKLNKDTGHDEALTFKNITCVGGYVSIEVGVY